MNDESVMLFGVHKGKRLIDIPGKYLLWLLDNQKAHGELKKYIEDNLDVLHKEQ